MLGRYRRSAHGWKFQLRAKPASAVADCALRPYWALKVESREEQDARREVRKRAGGQVYCWDFYFGGEDLPVPGSHRLAFR